MAGQIEEAAVIAGDRTARRLLAVSRHLSNHAANRLPPALHPNRLAPQLRSVHAKIGPETIGPAEIARAARRLPPPGTVARAKTWLRPRNQLQLVRIVRVDATIRAVVGSGVIDPPVKSGLRNHLRSSKGMREASRTTCLIGWPRRNRDASPSRIGIAGKPRGMSLATGMLIATACHL